MKYLHCPDCNQTINSVVEIMTEEWAYEQYMDENGDFTDFDDGGYKRDAHVTHYECPDCEHREQELSKFIVELKD